MPLPPILNCAISTAARIGCSDYRGRIVILNFWSCECPHSERTDRALMAMLCSSLGDRGGAALDRLESDRSARGRSRPSSRARRLPIVLLDPEHAVADLYEAQTTPEVFVIDRAGILRYRGAVDDVTFGSAAHTLLSWTRRWRPCWLDQLPTMAETPAYGCAIVREAVE